MSFVPHAVEWTSEKSKRLWDYYGSNSRYASAFFSYSAGPLIAKALFSNIRLTDDARLLDFSSGPGDFIAACLPRLRAKQEFYATDFSETYVRQVAKRFEADSHFKRVALTQSLRAPYADGFFDIVIATEVIEHLLDFELDDMLAECRRLLKPGGRVLFTTPNDEDYDAAKVICPDCGCVFHRWQHVRTWTVGALRARMELANFETQLVTAWSWLNWRGKLLSLIVNRRVVRDGLLYIGQKAA